MFKKYGLIFKAGKILLLLFILSSAGSMITISRTEKPVLHGRHWVAITGKPLGATAGAKIFGQGGNAVDAGSNNFVRPYL